MITSIIVCTAFNGVIGKDNKMPWKNKEEMNFFKEKTIGSTVIMGRKTFESIGGPLKDRFNIVLTKNKELLDNKMPEDSNLLFLSSLLEAIDYISDTCPECFIIGGHTIYDEAIKNDYVDRMYINVLHDSYQGDTYFPYFNQTDWITETNSKVFKSFKSYTLFRKPQV